MLSKMVNSVARKIAIAMLSGALLPSDHTTIERSSVAIAASERQLGARMRECRHSIGYT